MNRQNFITILIVTMVAILGGSSFSGAQTDEHGHGHEEGKAPHSDHKDAAEGDTHGHKEEGHDDHEESSPKFSKGKAIEEVKEGGKHFKLSEKALTALDIIFGDISRTGPALFTVPNTAIVYFQDETGVYVQRGGWFEMIEVSVKETKGSSSILTTDKLNTEDRVVINGVPFLRIAHLEAQGQGGQGHVH